MGMFSKIGAAKNAADNADMEEFAVMLREKKYISEEEYKKLMRSYWILFWAQLLPAIVVVVLMILGIVLPDGEDDGLMIIAAKSLVFYIVYMFSSIFWSRRMYWGEYTRWYKKGLHPGTMWDAVFGKNVRRTLGKNIENIKDGKDY